jgi:hypothetical protein
MIKSDAIFMLDAANFVLGNLPHKASWQTNRYWRGKT